MKNKPIEKEIDDDIIIDDLTPILNENIKEKDKDDGH